MHSHRRSPLWILGLAVACQSDPTRPPAESASSQQEAAASTAGSQQTGQVPRVIPPKNRTGGHFTIVDPDGRLVEGSVALFTGQAGTVAASLETNPRGRVGRGHVPDGLPSGDHDVSVWTPTTTFAVGTADVAGSSEVLGIAPTSGLPGTAFTITDPVGRMQIGDGAFFYPAGGDPALGTPAPDAAVNPDGTRLTGTVPSLAMDGMYAVAVRNGASSPSRFPDLDFFVEPLGGPAVIGPSQGAVGSSFDIDDPQGRIQPGDIVIFYIPGTDPALGTPAVESSIGSTYFSGFVPNVPTGLAYKVTVRASPGSPSRFPDLDFTVS